MTRRKTAYTEEKVRELNAQVPALIGSNGFAELLGVAPSNLDRVAGLPAHAAQLGRGRVWRVDVAEAFAAQRRAPNGARARTKP